MTHLTAELAYWINERENIRLKRAEGLPAPWSADPIFQTVRFCNVHREDDTVTQWIRKNWNKPDDPAWKFVLGRMLNLPESLEQIKAMPTNPRQWADHNSNLPLEIARAILKECRKLDCKIFTSAYTISTCGQKMDKLDYVFDVVAAVKRYEETFGVRYGSLAEAAMDLQNVAGLGTFLAGQVVADMKNTVGHELSAAPDWWTWSAPGPGSLRGLSWYLHGKDTGVTPVTYQQSIQQLTTEVFPFVAKFVAPIGMQDWQNICCEFSKYMKVKMNSKAHVRNRVAYA